MRGEKHEGAQENWGMFIVKSVPCLCSFKLRELLYIYIIKNYDTEIITTFGLIICIII